MKRGGLASLNRPHRTNQRIAMQMTDVLAEMGRQDTKWGRHREHADSHPSIEARLPSAAWVKFMVETFAAHGAPTWAAIALEEFLEALEARPGAARRGELVQLTAVLFQWIDDIDRRELKRLGERACGNSSSGSSAASATTSGRARPSKAFRRQPNRRRAASRVS